MQSNSFFYKEYRLFAGGQTVDKPLCFLKMGSQGRSPPTGSRGGSPSKIAPSHGEGVWGFGKDAEIERPKALQDAKPTKRSYRDREFALSYKKQTFSTS